VVSNEQSNCSRRSPESRLVFRLSVCGGFKRSHHAGIAAFHVAAAARSRSQEFQPPMNADDTRQNRHIGVHPRSSAAKKYFCAAD
jgi:hypothetical protein